MVRKLSEDDMDEVMKRYLQGENSTKISKDYPVSDVAIRGILRRRGLTRTISKSKRRYSLNEDFFENIDSEDKVYWLGFICADGYLYRDALSIALSNKDEEHLKKFKEAIDSCAPIKKFSYTNSKFCKIVIYSKKMSSDLRKFLNANKTFSLEFPTIQKGLEPHFIRGYFDGDGSISGSRKRAVFSITSNRDFLKEVKKRFIGIGLNDTKNHIRRKENPRIQAIIYSGVNNLERLYYFLYSDSTIFLERKKNKFREIIYD